MSDFISQHFGLFAASLIAMLPLFLLSQYFSWVSGDTSVLVRIAELLVVMVLSPLLYYFVAKSLKIGEVTMIREMVGVQISRVVNSRRKPNADAND